MTGERTTEGWRVRLTSKEPGRWMSVPFLLVWLCGWAAGECFALWMLVRGAIALLTGTPPDPGRDPLAPGAALMIGGFLLLWLALWTVGGVAAIGEVLRLVWGEDRIETGAGRVTVTWARGPFRHTRRFERDGLRGVRLTGARGRLSLETDRGHVELSGLGTRDERSEAAAAIRRELGLGEGATPGSVLPRGWEVVITPEGERALVADPALRRTQARVAGGVALALATIAFVVARQAWERWDLWIPAAILLAFTLAVAHGARWLTVVRWEWRVGSGRLTLRKRVGATASDVFEARRLALDVSTDSDNDTWYELQALADASPAPTPPIRWRSARQKGVRTIARGMHDGADLRALGAWLARESGLELEDRTRPEFREKQLVELKAVLEGSGALGRLAARFLDRLADRARKAG